MRVLVGMSGGVDSSVAAALLLEAGHEVVGATMKLWGGVSDSGCCSLGDVEDARRVAQQLDIVHHVFNFGDEFNEYVVAPYVQAHSVGVTPNPCVECNRYIKFDKFIKRAIELGFDAVATGHYARITNANCSYQLRRGVDISKDQSYVLHMLDQKSLSSCLLPIGEMTKDQVRLNAQRLGLRTATKPDSQDVCFIVSTGGRAKFLGDRIPLRSGRMQDVRTGNDLGEVEAVELVTIGQRKGMGGGTKNRRYAVDVNLETRIVKVGDEEDLLRREIGFVEPTFSHNPIVPGCEVIVQTSAHGEPFSAKYYENKVVSESPRRRVAPGQSIVFYDIDGDVVLGGAKAV